MEEQREFYDIEDYGGFLLRLAAYIIDGIVVSIPIYLIMFLTMGSSFLAMAGTDPENMEEAMTPEMVGTMMGGMGMMMLFSLIGVWLYFALMESSEKQATLGKMAVGIKVTDEFGDRISFGRATGRYFSKIISGMIIYIGFIMVAFTEKRQGLHDIIAKTLVLKKNVPPLD